MKSYLETKEIVKKVESIVKKYGIEDEDLKQELFLALWNSTEEINSDSSLEKFLVNCILQLEGNKEDEREYMSDNEFDEETILDKSQQRYNKISCLRCDLDHVFLDALTDVERYILEEIYGLQSLDFRKQHTPLETTRICNMSNKYDVAKQAIEKLRDLKYSHLAEYLIII